MFRHLGAFALSRAGDAHEMRHILTNVYKARTFEILGNPDAFRTKIAYFDFGSSILSYCYLSGEVRAAFHEDDYIRLQLCLDGNGSTHSGRKATVIRPDVIVCSPSDAVVEIGPECEQLILRIMMRALKDDLALLLGNRPLPTLSFETTTDISTAATSRLRAFIMQTVANIDISDEPIPPAILREIDQVIRLSVLYGIPNSASELLLAKPKLAAPWQVKRVEDWIDDHWAENITIQKIADISGVSVSSIYATFKFARGYTPAAYVKNARLRASREMLLKAAPNSSVTAIAFACRFGNSGHFARDYKQMFGELPSETLRRAKARTSS